jgi:hypothetical protein
MMALPMHRPRAGATGMSKNVCQKDGLIKTSLGSDVIMENISQSYIVRIFAAAAGVVPVAGRRLRR